MTASVVFYYKNALIIIKEKKRMKLHYQKIFFSIDMKLTYGKGNCNRNSNICNAIYRKYQKWSPRFMLYNLNPVCTTKFLIKFTGMYKDDKQVRIFCLIILKKVN